MALFNLSDLKSELQEVKEEGISFEDKQKIWNSAEDVADVVAALEQQKVVHYLNLDGNTLGVDAAAAIGKALEKHPEFRKALWKNIFTSRLKSEIPLALKHLSAGLMKAGAKLTVLDLSDNALGPNGMVGLEDLLRSPVCYTLQELRLNNCGLGIGGGKMLSSAIIDLHRASIEAGQPLNLKIFVAGRNRLENAGATYIAKIFSTLKTLEEITMPQNSIYHEGIAALAKGFKENPNLRVLNLNDNTITHKGALHLQEVFAATPLLRDINFGDCLLKTRGAYMFAESLEQHHNELEIVDLGYNEIGIDGGLSLASAMQNKQYLQKFNLDGNQFGYDGRELIVDAMHEAFNPDALCGFDDDQSESEVDEHEDGDDGTETDSDDNADEEVEVEEDENHNNDTTEEADNDDYDDYADETAYHTSPAFNTNLFSNSTTFSSKNVSFAADTTTSKALTAESFCLSRQPCTLQMFESLTDKNKLEAFKQVCDQFEADQYLLVLIFTTLKVAHLSKASSDALEIATNLYKECFDYATKTKQERRILNYILQQLGLLRSEVKFNCPYDNKSCRYALMEAIKQDKISNEYIKNVFNAMMENLDTDN